MGDINTVCISGRLGDDPEVKYFESGSIKVSFSIGVNRYSSKKQAEEVTWHKVVAWGKRAEFIGDVAKKGALACVQGTLEKDTYEDTDGNTRTNTYILVNEIKISNKREKAE